MAGRRGGRCAVVLFAALLGACGVESSVDERRAGEVSRAPVPVAPLARAEDGEEPEDFCGYCDPLPGCALLACSCGSICVMPACVRGPQGACEVCPTPRCLPSPPYCRRHLDCPLGYCASGACVCEQDTDCGDNPGVFCSGGLCAVQRCESRADCCDESGVCLACSEQGTCTTPAVSSPEPVLSCAASGGRGVPGEGGDRGGLLVLGLSLAAWQRRRRWRRAHGEGSRWAA
ncbi:hypothetical protein [Chondromyces crocatus]|uniref:Uncharacterized protein n=1 Tax=Chondromyces crocatus TaxID=52 RepID=A0A0K1EPS1_CHOCO|nr:hypothetical protein [Chondromyces crocatus]AKT42925.1 uncharacterized protein CMC5_071530 [Chondromyces crocatus]